MESYLESTILENYGWICLLYLFLSNLYGYPVQHKRIISVTLWLIIMGVLSVSCDSVILYGFGEITAFFFFSVAHIKYCILVLLLRYTLYSVLYILYGGSIYYGLYWRETINLSCLILCLLLYLFLLIWKYKIQNKVIRSGYIYTISINKKKYKGYMDTGNLSMADNYPVIYTNRFIDESYDTPIYIQTATGSKCMYGYKTWIQIYPYSIKKEVYIIYEPALKLPDHCTFLLNIHLLKVG